MSDLPFKTEETAEIQSSESRGSGTGKPTKERRDRRKRKTDKDKDKHIAVKTEGKVESKEKTSTGLSKSTSSSPSVKSVEESPRSLPAPTKPSDPFVLKPIKKRDLSEQLAAAFPTSVSGPSSSAPTSALPSPSMIVISPHSPTPTGTPPPPPTSSSSSGPGAAPPPSLTTAATTTTTTTSSQSLNTSDPFPRKKETNPNQDLPAPKSMESSQEDTKPYEPDADLMIQYAEATFISSIAVLMTYLQTEFIRSMKPIIDKKEELRSCFDEFANDKLIADFSGKRPSPEVSRFVKEFVSSGASRCSGHYYYEEFFMKKIKKYNNDALDAIAHMKRVSTLISAGAGREAADLLSARSASTSFLTLPPVMQVNFQTILDITHMIASSLKQDRSSSARGLWNGRSSVHENKYSGSKRKTASSSSASPPFHSIPMGSFGRQPSVNVTVNYHTNKGKQPKNIDDMFRNIVGKRRAF